jgi:hypothetical protein
LNLKQVLNEKAVFDEFSLSIPWLRKRRHLGDGPIFLKIGRMIRYRRADIEAYLATHVVNATASEEDS